MKKSIGFECTESSRELLYNFVYSALRMEILCPPLAPCRYPPLCAFNYTSTFSSSECIWKIAAASDNLIKVMGIIRGLP